MNCQNLPPDRMMKAMQRKIAAWLKEQDSLPPDLSLKNAAGLLQEVAEQHRELAGKYGTLHQAYRELVQANQHLKSQIALHRQTEESLCTEVRVLESMAEGVAVTDRRGNIIYTNPAFDAMFGYEAGELVGRHSNVLNHYPPEENLRMVRDILQRVNTAGVWIGEFHNRHKDGGRFYTSARISALRAGDKKLYISVQEDITASKRAGEELARQREMLQRLIDTIPVMLTIYDPHVKTIGFNEEFRRVLGWTEADMAVDDPMALFYPDPEYRQTVRQYMQSLEPGWRDMEVTAKDGSRVASSWANIRLTDDTHIGIGVDIRERKQAEEDLRESREDLNRAQAVAHTGSWRMNVQKNELTWSDECHRIFGIPTAMPLTYETFLSIVHPDDRQYVDQRWRAALQGEIYDIEHRIVVGDTVKWVRERAGLEFDREGRLLGGFGTTQDITELKEMEEALNDAHERTAAILDSISDSFFALDRDMVVTYYNWAAEKTLGRKATEVLGKKLFDAFPEARGSIFEEKYTEALHTGRAKAFEAYFAGPPFENWYDVRVYPFGQGLSVYFQVTTERKRAEEEIRRLANFPHLNPNPVLEVNEKGQVLYANPAARQGAENLGLAEGVRAFVPADLKEWFAAARRGGKRRYTLDLALAEASYAIYVSFPHNLSTARLYAMDITKRKKMEEALRRAHDELEDRVAEATASLRLANEQLLWEIEERQQAEERLRESEARFTAFMQHLPGAAVMRDLQGRHLFANETWEKLSGKKRDEWAGKAAADIWPRELAEHPKELDYQVLVTGQALERVEELELADGHHYFLAHHFPIRDDHGRPYLVGSIAVDITERHRAEAALAAEQQRLFAVLETMPAYVVLLTPDYTVPYANQEFIRRFGEAEAGQRCYEFLFGRTEPCSDCRTFKVLETSRPEYWEWLGPDGRIYAVYDYPFADADGSPLVLEMGVDITDRKRAEADLKKNEAMLRLILDTLPVGVWVADKDGQIIQGNSAGQRIWGGARYVGVEDYSVYKGWWADTGRRIEAEEWALARALQKRETSLGEIIDIQCFDGTRKTIINSAVPLLGENREILGAIVVNEDITAMRDAEKVMREQARQLEAFFAHNLTPFVFLDPQFNFLRVNRAYARACGKEMAEFPGHNHFELYPHEDNQAIFRRVVQTKTPYAAVAKPFEFPDHPERGVTYWDWTLVPILDEAGAVDFLVFSLNDVTERRRAELEAERQTAIVAGINRIFRDALVCDREEELGATCLAVAAELSGSPFGFIGLLNQKGTLAVTASSGPGWEARRQGGDQGPQLPTHLPVSGIYRSVIESGVSLRANDPAAHLDGRGQPEGHPALTAYLGVPLKHGLRVIGQIGLGNRGGGYSRQEQETVEALALPIVEALMHHRSREALKKSETKLRYLADQLLTAQESERRRLAGELHDELGHALLIMKLALRQVDKRLLPEQNALREELRSVLKYIDEVLEEVRRLYRDLSPGDLEDLGLTRALRNMINEFAGLQDQVSWQVDLPNLDGIFSLTVQTVVYRIFQEALTNIGKHANPSQVTITGEKTDHQVQFVIHDDGRGFSLAEAPGAVNFGVGLAAMEERLHMVGGSFQVWSREAAGTRLTFTIPALPPGEAP